MSAEDAESAAFVLALRGRSVRDTAVLRAMESVPRARFAPAAHRALARRDIALPLPHGATMTAPSEVAAMLALLRVEPGQRVLEIGTGSGYATALFLALGASAVTSLERVAGLAAGARALLAGEAAEIVQADGLADLGGAYDRVLVNATVAAPLPLWLGALAPGGRLVLGLPGPSGARAAAFADGSATACETGAAVRLAGLRPGRAAT